MTCPVWVTLADAVNLANLTFLISELGLTTASAVTLAIWFYKEGTRSHTAH